MKWPKNPEDECWRGGGWRSRYSCCICMESSGTLWGSKNLTDWPKIGTIKCIFFSLGPYHLLHVSMKIVECQRKTQSWYSIVEEGIYLARMPAIFTFFVANHFTPLLLSSKIYSQIVENIDIVDNIPVWPISFFVFLMKIKYNSIQNISKYHAQYTITYQKTIT